MSKPRRRYVVCIRRVGAEDLELRKLYEVRADEAAGKRGYLRVVDESGEDYLYPAGLFVPFRPSLSLQAALLRKRSSAS